MAIALRAVATTLVTTAAQTITVSVPAGTVDGDVMLFQIVCVGGTSATISTPTGWTLVDRSNRAAGQASAIFKRVASSEPANYSVSYNNAGGNAFAAGGIISYSGVDNTTPVNIAGGQGNAASTNNTAPTVTTTATGCQLVFFGCVANPTANFTSMAWSTPPTGETPQYAAVNNSSTGGASCYCADELLIASGATGTRVAVMALSAANVGQLVALNPATGGATNVSITAPIATATSASAAPTLASGTLLTSPIATGTAAAIAPVLHSGVTLFSPSATATGIANAPTLTIGTTITSPIATATADGLIPIISTGVSVIVTSPQAMATAAALVPIVSATGAAGHYMALGKYW